MPKDINKSLRLSQDVIDIIDAQPGDTFASRFEHLVYRYRWETDAREKELSDLQIKIDQAKARLKTLEDAAVLLSDYATTIRAAQDTMAALARKSAQLLQENGDDAP